MTVDSSKALTTKTGRYPYSPSDRRKTMESELKLLLKANNGVLTAEAVLAQAEDPTSALHTFFTWDETEAAHKWRLIEARQLITSIRIMKDDRNIRVRSLVSLNIDRKQGGGYRLLDDVMSRPDLRQHLLETALSELNAIERKYQHLQELQVVWGAVDSVEDSVAGGTALNEASASAD